MGAKYSYAFRPRKQIQRLLIADACSRLRAIAPLDQYEYIGFGGFEFIDFDLMRRRVGISRMVSYEKDSDQARYRFNTPFADIEIKFGPASQHLPFLDRATLRIVWLDYVQTLDAEVIQDVMTAADRLAAGSLLLVTVNAHPATPATNRRSQLVTDVGEERVPNGVDDRVLAKWGLANVQRGILLSALSESLAARGDGAEFEQLFHFLYADRAQMLTLGGLIITPAAREAFNAGRFHELDQVSRDEVGVMIAAPSLTARETLHLNAQLPLAPGGALDAPGLSADEKEHYRRFYRWYPPVPSPI
jgi:hypothetical protein